MAPLDAVRVGIDIGGTFTDVVVVAGTALTTWKVLSTPADHSEGFDQGLRAALRRAGDPPLGLVAHGTTVATNAVLERRGAVTALVTTEGFADVLAIGRQQRPSLYDLWADRPEPVVPRCRALGVPERTGPHGEVLLPLDEDAAASLLACLLDQDPPVESVAVCLLFSFANAHHEQRLRTLLAQAAPGVRVSLSSDVSPEFREYERASTTALDAFVGPVVARYIRGIEARTAASGAGVVVMRSGGATMSVAETIREPVHTLLSGPAAGVRGAVLAAREAGLGDLVTFDMGGTSTDVCLVIGGEPAITTESSVGGLPFRTPSVAVHTVGAGGGSILWLDGGGALRAGPRSAGAVPGPACYGRGGTLPTVTDAHLVLGQLSPDRFLGGRARLDAPAAGAVVSGLARAAGREPREVAEAGLRAVEAEMAKAVRVVSVERGQDPRGVALVAFGGAGPLHAVALAEALEMSMVLVPPAAGALSALGLAAAPLATDVSLTRPMLCPAPALVAEVFETLVARALAALDRQGALPDEVRCRIDCRYVGQAHEVPVPFDGDLDRLGPAFAAEHRARFGWDAGPDAVELVTFRVRAAGPDPGLRLPEVPLGRGAVPVAGGTVPEYVREGLGAGDAVRGPCRIWAEDCSVVVPDGWGLEVGRTGELVIRRCP